VIKSALVSTKWWSTLVLAAVFTTGCAAQINSLFNDDDEEITAPVGPQNPSPLSGREDGLGKPVLILKIDNIKNARPHEGLMQLSFQPALGQFDRHDQLISQF
jgi:hypothetical protein